MVQIHTQFRNFPATDALKDYIDKRLKALDKFDDLVQHVELNMYEERGQYNGTAIVKLKGKTVRVEVRDKDPMSVVDGIKDVLVREIKKQKEKLREERHRSGS